MVEVRAQEVTVAATAAVATEEMAMVAVARVAAMAEVDLEAGLEAALEEAGSEAALEEALMTVVGVEAGLEAGLEEAVVAEEMEAEGVGSHWLCTHHSHTNHLLRRCLGTGTRSSRSTQ